MPRTPGPLPEKLRDAPFGVGAALRAGVGENRLRSRDLTRPTYGVRAHRDAADSVTARARAFAIGLPGDVAFSHGTAARLLGLPTPHPWRADEPLHVTRHTDRPRIERTGVRWHRGLERRDILVIENLLVTDPVDTWADLATSFALDDLVALGDAILQADDGVKLAELRHVASDRAGRGVRRMREACVLLRHGSRSAWESKARVAFHQWDLPEPELNVDLYAASGRWLARPDFVWRAGRLVGEYDGDQHRTDRSAWQYERERRAGLEDEGWTYVEMTALSLTGAPQRAALRARLSRLLR